MLTQLKHFYKQHAELIDFIALIGLITLVYFFLLGSRTLAVPDEARYSEIPREMLKTGNFITPHLNFIRYFEKPPLFYWMQTLSIKLFGVSELSMRFMTFIMGITGCIITFAATRKIFNARIALFSSVILATSLLYYAMTHFITLDMTVSVWITGCLFSFLLATRENSAKKRRWLMWTCAACSALAVLTKGLIGLLLPGMIISLWLLFFNQWKLLTQLYLPSSIILFFAIALPWHLLVQQQHSEFFHFYFVTQQFSRYLTLSAERYEPNWFFIPILLLGFFPWVSFLAQTLYHNIKNLWRSFSENQTTGFLLTWFLGIFIFYSLSHSKLIPYITPTLPPLAVLTGRYLATAYKKNIHVGMMIYLFVALTLSVCLILVPTFYSVSNPLLAKRYLTAFAMITATGSIGSTVIYWKKNLNVAIAGIALTAIFSYAFLLLAIPQVNNRSIKSLAEQINTRIKPDDIIVCYKHYYQDLPFYTQKRVVIVDWQNEFAFGAKHQPDAKQWMLDTDQFFTLWKTPRTIFAVTRLKYYNALIKTHPELHFYVIAKTQRDILITNKSTIS